MKNSDLDIVILTYSERHEYLIKVLLSLEKMNSINKLFIVFNGVSKNSKDKLTQFLKSSSLRTEIIDLGSNKGSSMGYKVGIEASENTESKFVWLLDDDNIPSPDCDRILIQSYEKIHNAIGSNFFALAANRIDRHVYKKSIEENNPFGMIGSPNSFLGFNLFSSKSKKVRSDEVVPYHLNPIAVAPYGGLFFNKIVLNEIGYPNTDYFLYGDDFEYTYRFRQNNSWVFFVKDALIQDAETSFHIKKGKRNLGPRFFKTKSNLKTYYAVRNGIRFEQYFISNRLIYIVNRVIYCLYVLIFLLFNPNRWKQGQYFYTALLNLDYHD